MPLPMPPVVIISGGETRHARFIRRELRATMIVPAAVDAQEVPRPPPTVAAAPASTRPSSRSRPPPALEVIDTVTLYGKPRGMTGTGSGDAVHELLALDEVGDAALPDTRNGAQEERLGASASVDYETTAREREAAPPHVASRGGILASPGHVGGGALNFHTHLESSVPHRPSPFGSPGLSTVPLSALASAHPQAPALPPFQLIPTPSVAGASEESTPSITNSSSSSPSRSPSLSPTKLLSPTPGMDVDEKSDSPMHHLDYSMTTWSTGRKTRKYVLPRLVAFEMSLLYLDRRPLT